ncbi:capsular biosynthesis protein [Weissella sagaensis]|uniref:Capsular biosynthesis protein n=1 Tax=Weissella sagaensis TaxID=2559928 RepID=A0ABW1RUS0_9LACO|nr:capsular biosynthesis protein [Weissella sagaensis]
MNNQFTVTDLFKHLLRNAWWIIILGIISAMGMFFINKQPSSINVSATRTMYVGKIDSNAKDPNSQVNGNAWMLKTYREIGKDRTIIDPAVAQLKKQHVKVTGAQLRQALTLSSPETTLLIKAKISGIDKGTKAVKMVNAYTDSYAKNAPKLIADMPQPELMSSAKNAQTATIVSGGSPKKAALFGLVVGLAVGIVLAFFTGIYKNMKAVKN